MVTIAVIFIVKTHALHKSKEKKKAEQASAE
jgi:hypothetical protein